MKSLPKTLLVEGNLSDYQFCAEKIFAYAQQIGLNCDGTRVNRRDGEDVRITIICFDDKGDAFYSEVYAKHDDMAEILSAGYARAAAMLSAFHVKN